jgi:predicted nucleotidyltransferase
MTNEEIIFKAIVGSQSYGTVTPQSDIDYKGVYMQPIDDLISFNYKEQINTSKDETYYEVRRFLELLQTANPTMLELLYSPKDCIIKTSPQFELIAASREKFLTQKCLMSFGGYAIAQIKKAKGLDKKMNWEKQRVERKTPLDFIYALEGSKSIPITTWLKEEGKLQEYCGLAAFDHYKDCYALYYDYNPQYAKDSNREAKPIGFRGITTESSNELRLSSIPKGMTVQTIIHYNKDGYSMHCKDFKEYSEWLEKRNTQRYVDTQEHNQQIDGKNLLHCRRLLDMAIEIATEGTISVKRPNADYLLSIRKGEVKLKDIIKQAEEDIKGLEELFKKSSLPKECDKKWINDLLIEIRYLKN